MSVWLVMIIYFDVYLHISTVHIPYGAWNIYQHVGHYWGVNVGKHSIHGAYHMGVYIYIERGYRVYIYIYTYCISPYTTSVYIYIYIPYVYYNPTIFTHVDCLKESSATFFRQVHDLATTLQSQNEALGVEKGHVPRQPAAVESGEWMWWIAFGKLTVCYGKWPFIVGLPIKWWFSIVN